MTKININPKDKKIIALIGMMGVGKTTIGSKLAKKLGIYFIDSDHEIEDSLGKTVADIFADEGEEYFRKMESNIIQKIISRDEPMVLSLGGGAFVNEKIRDLVKAKAVCLWLDCNIDIILKRVGNKAGRPLLQSGNKKQKIKELISKRKKIYNQSDIRIDTGAGTASRIVNDIIIKIKDFIN